jgi:hypothetical protein
MALNENVGGTLSLPAGANLSAKQYFAVKLNSSGQVVTAGAGEAAIGILYNKPNAAGVIASVAPLNGRKLKAKAGGAITKGALLASDAAGELVAATLATTDTSDTGATGDALIGSHVLGVAIASAADGDTFQFLGLAMGAVPTTAA